MKLNDFTFYTDLQLEMFKNEIRSVINNGKIQIPIITGGAPNWAGNPGEAVIYSPTSGGMKYFVYNMHTAWVAVWSTPT